MPQFFMCQQTNSFDYQPIDCPEARIVLAVVALHADQMFASGSAVLVAPHIALTARHVVDDFFARLQGAADPTVGPAEFEMRARCYAQGAWWMFRVLRTFNTECTDICALYLTLAPGEPTDFEWPRITIDLLPAYRNSRVRSWGHVSPNAYFADAATGVIHWHARLVCSSGVVLENFPLRRDSVVVDYPAFHFDARVDASMSGGPVFNEAGHLVGINTRSLPATGPGDSHTSTAALLWPIPGLPFSTREEDYPPATNIRFVEDLHRLGFLPFENYSAVQVHREVASDQLLVDVSIPEDRL